MCDSWNSCGVRTSRRKFSLKISDASLVDGCTFVRGLACAEGCASRGAWLDLLKYFIIHEVRKIL